MAGYSVGDRVEVLWHDELYPAKVFKLHSSGKVDVVYEIDNTVGVFLTAKEHGLKLLPDKKEEQPVKKKKKDECHNKVHAKGLCGKHRSMQFCKFDGCTT